MEQAFQLKAGRLFFRVLLISLPDWLNPNVGFVFLKYWKNGKHPSSISFLLLLNWKNEKHLSRGK
jgi:hypothetical protein